MIQEPSLQQSGVVTVSVPKESVTSGTGFSFPLPVQVFAEATPDAPVQVRLSNGDPLPTWLNFNSETNSFVASAVPDGAFPLQITVTVGEHSTGIVISERMN